jgi:hypothetical protein
MGFDMRALTVLGAIGVFAGTGCIGAGEESDGDIGFAALPQLDGGNKVWRGFVLTLNNPANTPLGEVFVFNQAVGSFVTGTEYWYVNQDSLANLGKDAIVIAYTDSSSMTAPSDPGYKNEQTFTNAQNVSWGSGWTTDPLSGGSLFRGPGSSTYLRLNKSSASPPSLTSVAWYQILSGGTPSNISPSGTFNVGLSVTVPSGDTGYDVQQSP